MNDNQRGHSSDENRGNRSGSGYQGNKGGYGSGGSSSSGNRSSRPGQDRPSSSSYTDRATNSELPSNFDRPYSTDRTPSSDRSARPERTGSGAPDRSRGGSQDRSRSGAPDRSRGGAPDRRGSSGGRSDDSRTHAQRGGRDRDQEQRQRPIWAEDRAAAGRHDDPPLVEGFTFSDLDRDARSRLRTLTKENAEFVGLHLLAAGEYLEDEPELAYKHAQAAMRRGGRVDIVREAVAITAYRTARYAEALREFRTVRRLNGSSEHLPIMADCERGLERPDRAIALARSEEASTLDAAQTVELNIVVAGARADLGEYDTALSVLKGITSSTKDRGLLHRVAEAQVGILELAGRQAEAIALAKKSGIVLDSNENGLGVVVYDVPTEDDAPEQGGKWDSKR